MPHLAASEPRTHDLARRDGHAEVEVGARADGRRDVDGDDRAMGNAVSHHIRGKIVEQARVHQQVLVRVDRGEHSGN